MTGNSVPVTPRQRTLVLLFAILGLGASAASTYVHYQLLKDPGYASFCDISASVNCETVYQSRYGTVRGVPVALAGLLWFTLVFLLAVFDVPGRAAPSAGRTRAAEPMALSTDTPAYIFLLSTAALAVVFYMAYASFVVLKTLCILCAITYVAVLGVFGVSGAAAKARLASMPRRVGRDLRALLHNPVAATVAVFYVIGAATAVAFFPRADTGAVRDSAPAAAAQQAVAPAPQIAQFEQWMAAQTRVPLIVPNDGATVVIVKFNDYQCPPCRQTFLEYKPIIERYQAEQPGKVKFVTKDFPLEAECNTGGVHVAACEAAAAVRLARARNRGEAMEQWLFERQASMSPDLVREGVKQVAGVNDFDAQYPKLLEQVKGDVAMGRQLGVSRTPTFFINGVKIEGGLRPEFFDAALAFELKRTAGPQP
jgi:uncharacterized membrane protein/protein-disulfide isomerase